jgi:multiple sugar transport system permease protein
MATTAPSVKSNDSRGRTVTVVKHIGLLATLLVLLYPLVWLLATSLKPADEVLTSLKLLPSSQTSG